MPAIDREAPLRFLRTAFQQDDWVAIFLKSYETGRVHQRVGPLDWVMHPRFQAWLRFKNSQKFNVYCGVNAIAPWRRTRTRDAIGAVRHVFLDADRDGPAVLARIAGRSDLPEPSYVLHSSPNRVHVFWRVEGFELSHVETLQRHLARELDTDLAATPSTQATRIPGFFNHKPQYISPHLITIDYRSKKRVGSPVDFPVVEASKVRTPAPLLLAPTESCFVPVERARRYLERVPPAITGQRGDVHTFRVCCRIVRGFALSDREALEALKAWNARCQPPWTGPDLLDKLRRARRYGREPMAVLLRS